MKWTQPHLYLLKAIKSHVWFVADSRCPVHCAYSYECFGWSTNSDSRQCKLCSQDICSSWLVTVITDLTQISKQAKLPKRPNICVACKFSMKCQCLSTEIRCNSLPRNESGYNSFVWDIIKIPSEAEGTTSHVTRSWCSMLVYNRCMFEHRKATCSLIDPRWS